MISENELQQLKKILEVLQEKCTFFEKELLITASPEIKFELKKKIEEYSKNINDIKQNIEKGTLPTNWKNTYALPPEIFELKQRIKLEIIPSIRKYEAEYWTLYPQEEIILSDEEAEKELIEVEQALTSIKQIPLNNHPSQFISLLQEIREKLDENKTASGKLKVVIPLLPAIVCYELEIEPEGLMYQTWEKIKAIVRR